MTSAYGLACRAIAIIVWTARAHFLLSVTTARPPVSVEVAVAPLFGLELEPPADARGGAAAVRAVSPERGPLARALSAWSGESDDDDGGEGERPMLAGWRLVGVNDAAAAEHAADVAVEDDAAARAGGDAEPWRVGLSLSLSLRVLPPPSPALAKRSLFRSRAP